MSDTVDCEYHGTATAACLECVRDNRDASHVRISTLEARIAELTVELAGATEELAQERERRRLLEEMYRCVYCTETEPEIDAARARIAELERERGELRRQLTFQRDTNHARNVEMDALHYVWCNGGCKGGVHRFTPGELTEEIVAAAERNTKRMRHWLANHLALLAIHPAQPETPAAPGPYSGT